MFTQQTMEILTKVSCTDHNTYIICMHISIFILGSGLHRDKNQDRDIQITHRYEQGIFTTQGE